MSPELRASLERDRQELPGVWEQNRRRNADEPLRLKVSFMRARVEADPPGYASPDELERDLKLVADSLDEIGRARLNSSHSQISYAVFCLKKKKNHNHNSSI